MGEVDQAPRPDLTSGSQHPGIVADSKNGIALRRRSNKLSIFNPEVSLPGNYGGIETAMDT